MAADGMVSCGSQIIDKNMRKVHRVLVPATLSAPAREVIVGIAGSVYNVDPFVAWLRAGRPSGDKPDLSEDFEALVLEEGAGVLSYNDKCQTWREPDRAAIGSGMSHALAALDAGADPEKAVKIAIERDHGTGGKILVEKL